LDCIEEPIQIHHPDLLVPLHRYEKKSPLETEAELMIAFAEKVLFLIEPVLAPKRIWVIPEEALNQVDRSVESEHQVYWAY
jgi:hypothetical protein